MRRADTILDHPLAQQDPTITVSMSLDAQTGEVVHATLDHKNVPVADLVYVATLMRPIVYLRDDSISLAKLTGRIEREHPGFRGKLKPLRTGFEQWLATPIVQTWTIGEVPVEQQSNVPWTGFLPTAPNGVLPNGIPLTDMTSDLHYALVFFYGEFWHSDDDKAAEYAAADAYEKRFIAKCAEVRTLHAIPFIRSLHTWVTEVRRLGMDI